MTLIRAHPCNPCSIFPHHHVRATPSARSTVKISARPSPCGQQQRHNRLGPYGMFFHMAEDDEMRRGQPVRDMPCPRAAAARLWRPLPPRSGDQVSCRDARWQACSLRLADRRWPAPVPRPALPRLPALPPAPRRRPLKPRRRSRSAGSRRVGESPQRRLDSSLYLQTYSSYMGILKSPSTWVPPAAPRGSDAPSANAGDPTLWGSKCHAARYGAPPPAHRRPEARAGRQRKIRDDALAARVAALAPDQRPPAVAGICPTPTRFHRSRPPPNRPRQAPPAGSLTLVDGKSKLGACLAHRPRPCLARCSPGGVVTREHSGCR